MHTPLAQLGFLLCGRGHSTHETIEALVSHFNLTEEDLSALLPSGTQNVFAYSAPQTLDR